MPGRRRKKTVVSLSEFKDAADPLEVLIDGKRFIAIPWLFATGSYGYRTCDKIEVVIGGKVVGMTISLNLTIHNSKPRGEKT